MQLKSTRQEYESQGEDGYRFTIVAEKTADCGWEAKVVLRTSGHVTAEDAVFRLALTAQAFLRHLEEGAP